MSQDPKVIRIEFEYSDGMIEFAEGEDASVIHQWLMGGQTMNLIHGAVYKGPRLKERRRADAE